jgi:tripartite-type tricarboxylate transporter receptor subunit TctC
LKKLIRTMLLASLAGFASVAHAQDWPKSPIKLVMPVGPGLATDLTARMFADDASKALGVGVVVENITGGSGVLGAQTVARAAPDGYTIFFANSSALTSNMYLLDSIKYDPTKDFTALAMMADSSPFIVSVNKDLPVKSIAELIAYGKAHPGELSMGIDATSGFGLVTGRLLNKRGAIGMTEVAYRATPQMVQDATAGRIQVMISVPLVIKPFVESGQLRMLAVSSKKRFPGLDDLPTIAETIPGFDVDGWFALMAPAKTPTAILDRLNAEVAKFLDKEDVRKRLVGLGVVLSRPGTPETAAAFVRGQQEAWGGIARELDLKPQ